MTKQWCDTWKVVGGRPSYEPGEVESGRGFGAKNLWYELDPVRAGDGTHERAGTPWTVTFTIVAQVLIVRSMAPGLLRGSFGAGRRLSIPSLECLRQSLSGVLLLAVVRVAHGRADLGVTEPRLELDD